MKSKPPVPLVCVTFEVLHDGVDVDTISEEIKQFIEGDCKPFLKKLAAKIRSYGEEQYCGVAITLNDFPRTG